MEIKIDGIHKKLYKINSIHDDAINCNNSYNVHFVCTIVCSNVNFESNKRKIKSVLKKCICRHY